MQRRKRRETGKKCKEEKKREKKKKKSKLFPGKSLWGGEGREREKARVWMRRRRKTQRKKREEKKKKEMKTSGFVKGRREQREKRERISLRKDSRRYTKVERKKGKTSEESEKTTVSGSRRPSVKTGYSHELRGISVEKAYGDQGYRKGMNKRPRRKLTLGNMVMMKTRKRVEGRESKNPNLVGGQRIRQRIRVAWDSRNLERRKAQIEYRETGEKPGRTGEKEKGERKSLIQGRKSALILRECEVYRNGYEVRSRYQTHERGKKRKEWWLDGKYAVKRGVQAEEGEEGREETERETTGNELNQRRKGLKREEGKDLEGRYEKERKEYKEIFERKRRKRRERCERHPSRKELGHVKTLRERSDRTRKEPRQVKNREKLERDQEGSEGSLGKEGDESREVLMAAPRTQYFAKRKNLTRRRELEDPKGSLGGKEVKKWRKVPEKERTERNPTWSELEAWMNRRMQKVEDENRKGLLRGNEAKGREAKYMEFGKKAVYFYGSERSERWRKQEKREEIKERFKKGGNKGKDNGKPKRIW